MKEVLVAYEDKVLHRRTAPVHYYGRTDLMRMVENLEVAAESFSCAWHGVVLEAADAKASVGRLELELARVVRENEQLRTVARERAERANECLEEARAARRELAEHLANPGSRNEVAP